MKGVKKVIWTLISVSLLFSSEKIIRIYLPTWNDIIENLTPVFGKKLPEVAAGRPNEWYDFIVYDEDIAKIKSANIPFEIIVDDLEKMKELVKGQYHSYDQVKQILYQMQSSYPSLAKVESIGPSYQGRWIYGIKVSDNVSIDENETELVFSGCHHAREWATVETALFIADTLLRGYGSDPTITQIVNTREIWVFPIINPDGYVYDYPNQLMWRKNRQPFHGYIGTDLNRNYNGTCETDARGGWGWIPSGGSVTHLPSHETFCGFKGFSAPEIKAYSDFLKQRYAVGIIDFHSYSELVLGAWGHVSDPTPHSTWYTSIGQGIAQRIQRLSGGYYTYQTAYQLYPTSGGSLDWEYGWSHFVNGFPCLAFVNEIGTQFYQPVSQLDHIMRQNFKGALFLMQKGDSIRNYMKCFVPAPKINPLDTVGPNFNLIWRPRNKETNNPIYWEIMRYQNPQPQNESFESGTGLWNLQNFNLSTARKRTGNYSLFAGNANNIRAQAVTKYPYFVKPGDSLTFWIWYSLQNEYDVAIVEVSEDGRDWYPLVAERWTGNSNNWVRYAYSLNQWAGKSLYFRWRVMTDGSTLNEGFYIDDIYPVANWGVIQTVATQIYDTIYSFTNLTDGTYYFSVRGYNNQFGWGNWSTLEEVVVKSTYISEKDKSFEDLKIFSGKNIKILYSSNQPTPLRVYFYDVSGRVVKSYNFEKLENSGEIVLNPELSKGIYIIKVKGKGEKEAKTLFVR